MAFDRPDDKASHAFREKIDIDGFDHPKKIYDLTDALIDRAIPTTTSKACQAATSAACSTASGT